MRSANPGELPAAGDAQKRAARFYSLDEHWMRQALTRAHGPKHGHVSVGLLLGDRILTASVDAHGVVRPCEPEGRRGPAGCIAKLLTGTLAMRAASAGLVEFSDAVSDLIANRTDELAELLNGITLRQLLNHTHGIDTSDHELITLTSGGRIDLRPLGDSHLSRRLFAPGTLYSYGSAGAWVVAAALEHIHSAPFFELLESHLLRAAQIHLPRPKAQSQYWCPANGADLRMSVPELLSFLHWFLLQGELRGNAELALPARPPGWCVERGACAGWKYFGDGWYGHNMALPNDSLLVRVHMEDRLALVVAAEGVPAALITIRMFGRLLPEYLSLRLPKPLVGADIGPSAARYVGKYENRAMAMRISFSSCTGMEAEIVSSLDPRAPTVHAKLHPGTQDAWLVESADAAPFHWVQFIAAGNAEPTHVWDGKQVLRRG